MVRYTAERLGQYEIQCVYPSKWRNKISLFSTLFFHKLSIKNLLHDFFFFFFFQITLTQR